MIWSDQGAETAMTAAFKAGPHFPLTVDQENAFAWYDLGQQKEKSKRRKPGEHHEYGTTVFAARYPCNCILSVRRCIKS
jgi:hypothetical protein